MKTYKETLEWLRDNGVLNRVFMYHKISPNTIWRQLSVYDIFVRCQSEQVYSPKDFIFLCLTSCNTDEGLSFWADVNYRFGCWFFDE